MAKVFRNPGEQTWMLKVQDSRGKWYTRSTGTPDEDAANDIAALVQTWREGNKWEVLDRITVRNTLKLRDVMKERANVEKAIVTKGRKEARSESAIADEIVRRSDAITVSEWLDRWADDKMTVAYRGHVAKATQRVRYIAQLRLMIAEGGAERNTVEWWEDPENINEALASMHVSSSTRHKYKIAISQFAKFLLRKRVLTFNPVSEGRVVIEYTKQELRAKKEPKFYTPENVQALLAWEPRPDQLRRERRSVFAAWRAVNALAFGSGAEMDVMKKLRARDFDRSLRIFVALGEKNGYRDRKIGVVVGWCWDVVEAYLDTLKPGDYFVPRSANGIPQQSVLYGLQQLACEETEVEYLGFHKHRHGFTVAHIDVLPKRVIQDQLGHGPGSTVIDTVYGKHTKQNELVDRMKDVVAADAKRTKRRKLKMA